MQPTVLSLILSAIPATILALAALMASLKNGAKLNEVHLSLNSRLSQLVEAAKAQGMIDQRTYTDLQTATDGKTVNSDRAAAILAAADAAKAAVDAASKAAAIAVDAAAKAAEAVAAAAAAKAAG